MNYEKHWQTDKTMNVWAKGVRKKLEGRWLDSFNQQFATMSKANAVHMMNVNFARLIGGLDEEE